MARLLILALDGLEIELVERWNLRNLEQAVYGAYEVVKSPRYGKAHTPSAWATIITGRPPEEHGIDDWWTYGRILDKLRYLPPLAWIKGKRRILWRLGIKPRTVDKRDHRLPTIFDVVKPSKALFVPTISEPQWIHEEYNRALERGLESYISKIWEIHRYRKRVFFEELGRGDEWRLFMAWFDIADLLGHVCITKCRLELMKAYLELNALVGEARKMVGDNTLILVVSDHGMKPMPDGTGDHSDKGFWSLSRDVPWFRPRRATDFYNLVLRLCK